MSPQRIPVTDIDDGMVLAQDAITDNGSVLLAAGTALQARHSGLLERRGIEQIVIQTPEDTTPAAAPDAPAGAPAESDAGAAPPGQDHRREVEAYLTAIFADVRDDEMMAKLYALACERADRLVLPDA